MNVPHQVQSLIDSMLNKKDNVFVRGNYRTRLSDIQRAVEQAITTYDKEVGNYSENERRRKRA